MKRRILLVDDDLAVLLTSEGGPGTARLRGGDCQAAQADALARLEASRSYHLVIS
jgi:hypothetical protein